MTVQEWPLDKLRPYVNNPRKNDSAVDAVAASIREFGFRVPIIVDKDGEIIAGHTRLKAAIKLGLKTVPVIVADDLTDEQVRAFRLADNKVGELAAWDMDLLASELRELSDMDMAAFGFEEMPEAEALALSEGEGAGGGGKVLHCPKCGFVFEVDA